MGDIAEFQCMNCMPEVVFITGYNRFRAHMRAIHGLRRLTDDECNQYRSDGRAHYNRFNTRNQTGINLSAEEFGNLIQKVQATISGGIERGISTAVQASVAVQGMIGGNAVSYPVVANRPNQLWSNRSVAGTSNQLSHGPEMLSIANTNIDQVPSASDSLLPESIANGNDGNDQNNVPPIAAQAPPAEPSLPIIDEQVNSFDNESDDSHQLVVDESAQDEAMNESVQEDALTVEPNPQVNDVNHPSVQSVVEDQNAVSLTGAASNASTVSHISDVTPVGSQSRVVTNDAPVQSTSSVASSVPLVESSTSAITISEPIPVTPSEDKTSAIDPVVDQVPTDDDVPIVDNSEMSSTPVPSGSGTVATKAKKEAPKKKSSVNHPDANRSRRKRN